MGRSGLLKTDFYDGPYYAPSSIRAYVDRIVLVMPDNTNLDLPPDRLNTIREMLNDWWESHWKSLYLKKKGE